VGLLCYGYEGAHPSTFQGGCMLLLPMHALLSKQHLPTYARTPAVCQGLHVRRGRHGDYGEPARYSPAYAILAERRQTPCTARAHGNLNALPFKAGQASPCKVRRALRCRAPRADCPTLRPDSASHHPPAFLQRPRCTCPPSRSVSSPEPASIFPLSPRPGVAASCATARPPGHQLGYSV
jgi:hypothetical protein